MSTQEQIHRAFSEWADVRGVWPRLTSEEIFFAGWQAAQSAQGEPESEIIRRLLDDHALYAASGVVARVAQLCPVSPQPPAEHNYYERHDAYEPAIAKGPLLAPQPPDAKKWKSAFEAEREKFQKETLETSQLHSRVGALQKQLLDMRAAHDDQITSLLQAAQQALEALQTNHKWHIDYDDYGGYPGSDLEDDNVEAITALRAAIKEGE